MFKKLMVPVDLSNRHEKALKTAIELATLAGGEVTLLHVVEVPHGFPVEEDPEFYRRLENISHDHLSRMADRLREQGVSCRYAVRLGESGPEVLRFAAEEGMELIVLSSHPIDPKSPGAGWLSLSYLIGIGAPCNVLLIK